MPESPFSLSNNEMSNKLDLTRPLRPSENFVGTNDKMNELDKRPKPVNDKLESNTTRTPGNKMKISATKTTKPTIRTSSTKTTTTTTTTTLKPLINDKLDFSTRTTKRLRGTRKQTTTKHGKTSKRTKRKVRRTKRKTTKEPLTTTTTIKNRRNDGWIVINENDGKRQTTTQKTLQTFTNRRTTVRGWVLLENRKLQTERHDIVKREANDKSTDITEQTETGRDLEGKNVKKISDLIDFDRFEREERDLKTTTEGTTTDMTKDTKKTSRILPVRYNLLNKRLTAKDKTKTSIIDDKLDRLKSSVNHRLDWTRKTKHPNLSQQPGFLNQDNATGYLRNHAVNLDEKQYRTNEYYLDDEEEFDHYRPVPIRIPQRHQATENDRTRRPIGFRNNMPIYDLTQTKIDTQFEHNFVHTVTSTLRPGVSISYEVEIPLLSTKPTKIRIRPTNRPESDSYGYYRPGSGSGQQQKYKTTTNKPELQTFYSVETEEDERPFHHETYSYRPPLRTTPRPISFISSSTRPVSVTMDPLSFFMASTTSLSSLYHDEQDMPEHTNDAPQTVKVQSTFAAILGNNYPTFTDSLLGTSHEHDSDPDVLHIPPHLIPEVDEKYFFNDRNWEKLDDNKRHDTTYRQPLPPQQQQTYTSASYIDYSQYNTDRDRDTKTKYYYVDNILHKKDAYGDIYRKKGGRRYAETFSDKDNDTHWIRVTRQIHENNVDNTNEDKVLGKDGSDKFGKTIRPNKRRQQGSVADTGFVSLVVLNSAER